MVILEEWGLDEELKINKVVAVEEKDINEGLLIEGGKEGKEVEDLNGEDRMNLEEEVKVADDSIVVTRSIVEQIEDSMLIQEEDVKEILEVNNIIAEVVVDEGNIIIIQDNENMDGAESPVVSTDLVRVVVSTDAVRTDVGSSSVRTNAEEISKESENDKELLQNMKEEVEEAVPKSTGIIIFAIFMSFFFYSFLPLHASQLVFRSETHRGINWSCLRYSPHLSCLSKAGCVFFSYMHRNDRICDTLR
jgi:hypothetical protein